MNVFESNGVTSMFKKSIAATLIGLSLCASANSQQTQNALNAEINARLPSGQNPGITAANLRQVLFDMVTASFQGFTATQLSTMMMASNNNAPITHIYNLADADVANILAIFAVPGQFAVFSGAATGAPMFAGGVNNVNNSLGNAIRFHTAFIGYENISAAGIGNYGYPVFGRGDLNNTNGSMSSELDCNNQGANSPTTLPPTLGSNPGVNGVLGAWCIGLQAANIGLHTSAIAFRAVTIGQYGGPASWLTDFYADPPPDNLGQYGIFIDATASFSPKFTAYFKNTGATGNAALTNQITGSFTITAPPNPVIQNLNAAGLTTFQVDQHGGISINASVAAPLITGGNTTFWAVQDETQGFTTSSSSLLLDTYSGSGACVGLCAGNITARTGRGTAAAPTTLLTGDVTSFWGAVPCIGGPPCTFVTQVPAIMRTIWTDSGTNQGSAFVFLTSPNGGVGNRAEAVRIQGSGGLSVGLTTDPGIGGILANKTIGAVPTSVGSLPTCNSASKGFRSFVVDELAAVGFNTIATGSGANNVPVFCDGTNWRIG